MKFVMALFLLILVYVSSQGNTPITLCGRQLADARELLCYGAEDVNKRALTTNFLDTPEDHEEWSWHGHHGEHRTLMPSWSRYKRQGLATECCIKPCTPEVILSYC